MTTILDIDPLEYGDTSLVKIKANFNALNDDKQEELVSGTNIKTVNGETLLGGGNIEIVGGGAVDSVNGQTGAVVLDTDDISEGTNKFVQQDVVTTLGADDTTIPTSKAVIDAIGFSGGGDMLTTTYDPAGKSDQVITESDYTPAHSFLAQQSGTGSPSSVSVGNNEIVGRQTGGGADIEGLSATQVRSIINVEDGAEANLSFGTATGTVLEGSNDALYAKLSSANTFTKSQTITGATSTVAGLKIRASNIGENEFIEFQNDGGAKRMGVIYDNSVPGFGIQNRTGGDLVRIVESTGNVGIGKTNPAHELDVNGTITANRFILPVGTNLY